MCFIYTVLLPKVLIYHPEVLSPPQLKVILEPEMVLGFIRPSQINDALPLVSASRVSSLGPCDS